MYLVGCLDPLRLRVRSMATGRHEMLRQSQPRRARAPAEVESEFVIGQDSGRAVSINRTCAFSRGNPFFQTSRVVTPV